MPGHQLTTEAAPLQAGIHHQHREGRKTGGLDARDGSAATVDPN